MKNCFFVLCFSLVLSGYAVAQATDGFKKIEFFAGYSNGQNSGTRESTDDFLISPAAQHGFNVSSVYNLTRYVGIKGDFSATFKKQGITSTTTSGGNTLTISYRANSSLYNFLGGIQVKDNSNNGRFKPFAHALVGAGHRRIGFSDFACSPNQFCAAIVAGESSQTGVAGAFGGGLDIKINKRIQFRVIQVDYNPVRAFGRTEHNARIGAGIVF